MRVPGRQGRAREPAFTCGRRCPADQEQQSEWRYDRARAGIAGWEAAVSWDEVELKRAMGANWARLW